MPVLRSILVTLSLLLALGHMLQLTDAKPSKLCDLDNMKCNRNPNMVSAKVAEICEACGRYWSNIPGFAYCCRCSDYVFQGCAQAVFEVGRR